MCNRFLGSSFVGEESDRQGNMDYEIQRCTRHCSTSGRELLPGEPFYSALVTEGAELCRLDYAADAWQGPPENTIGWWKSEIPDPKNRRMHWAPNDVMLQFFDELGGQPDEQGGQPDELGGQPDEQGGQPDEQGGQPDEQGGQPDERGGQPDRRAMKYVLSLLLVRRRVMRLEENETDERGNPLLVLYCPRRDATYKVPAVVPDQPTAEKIQDELTRLLE